MLNNATILVNYVPNTKKFIVKNLKTQEQIVVSTVSQVSNYITQVVSQKEMENMDESGKK